MACFHVYTKGLVDRELFLDKDDFIAGMNILAVVSWSLNVDVKLLAFVLMSNHVHFFMRSSKDKSGRFIWLYKHLLSRYLRKKYGYVKSLRGLETTVSEVPDNMDTLKRLVAYILNNPVKAGINCVAYGYEWSSARCYFNKTDYHAGTTHVRDYTVRQLRRMLHSRKSIPSSWLISPSGYILPQCYVDTESVESYFKTSRSLEYFLSTSQSLKRGTNEHITFSDAIVIASMKELLEKKYGVESIGEMDEFLRKNIVKDIRGRFSASSKQISRVTGIPVADIIRYLE